MKKIIFAESDTETIYFDCINEADPVFAKDKEGKFIGMAVSEDRGWIIRVGGCGGASGYFETLEKCLSGSLHLGYTYFVE